MVRRVRVNVRPMIGCEFRARTEEADNTDFVDDGTAVVDVAAVVVFAKD